MKKFLVALTAISMAFFMAACSSVDVDNKKDEAKEPVTEDTTKDDEAAEDKIWDMSVLPVGFSEKPEGAVAEKLTVYEEYEDNYTGYKGTLFKLDFRANKDQLEAFGEKMENNKWLGGIDIPDEEETDEYITGKWANGEWYATIAKGYYDKAEDGLDYVVKMEIYRAANVFPAEIESYFPGFDKFTVVTNDYVGYDEEEEKYNYEFKGKLDDFWCWYFTGAGAFVGVTEQEVEDYLKVLSKEGFDIYRYPEKDDSLRVEAEKYVSQGRETVTVYVEFDRDFNTVEMTYTNNMEYFKQR